VAPIVTEVYSYPGSGPSQVTPVPHNPFKVRVTYAGTVQEKIDLSFLTDTVLQDFVF
jgi:hypothetical protein